MLPKTAAEEFMYAVKRIEGLSNDSYSSGSGYIYAADIGHNQNIVLTITNKHVVKDLDILRIYMHIAKIDEKGEQSLTGELCPLDVPLDGQTLVFNHANPDLDLCAIDIGAKIKDWENKNPGKSIYYKTLTKKHFWSDEDIQKHLDASEPISMVGCPNGIWDDVNGFPIFRRGVTATHPLLNFKGEPYFLADIAVFPGSSGSPIILLESGLRKNKDSNEFQPLSLFGVIGTLFAGATITQTGGVLSESIQTTQTTKAYTQSMMHLGYCIKSQEIINFIESIEQIGRNRRHDS